MNAQEHFQIAIDAEAGQKRREHTMLSIAASLIELNERLRSIDRTLVETLGQLKRS